VIPSLLQPYPSSLSQLKPFAFIQRWVIVAVMGMSSLQCSWSPEVETVLHDSHGCVISLKTTQALKIVPKHPASISEPHITNILMEITKTQEEGMLQQLLLSTTPTVSVFSPSQIEILAPQISLALSQITTEEIVHFRCLATDEQSSLVQGTVAVFPPTYLLLTLKDDNETSGIPSKIQNSSRRLQTTTSLSISQNETLNRVDDVRTFMAIPSTSHGIIINYQRIGSSNQNNQENQPNKFDTPIINDEKGESPREMDSLNEQVKDLRKKVDQQAEEIRRLKQTAPQ
jgi:hypothetical protein